MNKKTLGLFFLVLLIIISVSTLLFLLKKPNQNKNTFFVPNPPSANKISSNSLPIQGNSVSNASNKVQIISTQPFFQKPTLLLSATVPKSNPVLLQSSGDELLFRSYMGTVYLYNIVTSQRIVLGYYISSAYITPNQKYVIFDKDNQLFSFKLTSGGGFNEGFIATIPNNDPVLQYAYHNGILFYTYQNNHSISANYAILPDFSQQYTGFKTTQIVNLSNISPAIVFHNEFFYTFIPSTNSIDFIQYNANPAFQYAPNVRATNVTQLDFNKQNQWLLVENHQILLSTGQNINSYNISNAAWLDNVNILFLSNNSLYRLNTASMKVSLIQKNVSYFAISPSTQSTFYETKQNTVYELQKS